MPSLTIFSAPKAFADAAAISQRNAVWSWTQLGPEVEVILIGDEEGIEETARSLGTRHVADVARSPAGVPLLSDVFRVGQEHARTPSCMFLNVDIVLGPDVLDAVKATAAWSNRFLMVGQRWDTPIEGLLDDLGPDWWQKTRRHALEDGRLDSFLWIDYFAFPTGQYPNLPPFVIGRPGYDNWLVWHTRARSIPVVDASNAVVVVHQRHTYAEYGGSKKHVWTEDAETNADLIGDRRKLFTIGHATHRLDVARHVEPARGPKYTLARVYTRSRPAIDATVRGPAQARHRRGARTTARDAVAAAPAGSPGLTPVRLVRRVGARRRPSRRHTPRSRPSTS